LSRNITSLTGYVKVIYDLQIDDDNQRYYRGHSDLKYRLLPSVMRSQQRIDIEDKLFQEMIAANPDEFSDDKTTLDKLVRMQHHALPTRLLDTTSNPLVALYFACCEHDDKNGEVVIIDVPKTEVRFFDSDTVSCIANLALLTASDRNSIDFNLGQNDFNDSQPIKKLIYRILQEKPFFQPKINPDDLKKVISIHPKLNNKRIIAQSGAFLLFGEQSDISDNINGFQVCTTRIDKAKKAQVRNDLARLNITRELMYPDIEKVAEDIRTKYNV
jgi:hypothetical protein